MPGHGTYKMTSGKELENQIIAHNKSHPDDSLTLKQTEAGELYIEGFARVHWGATVPIHFKRDDSVSPNGTGALRLPRTARLSYAVAMQNSLYDQSESGTAADGGAGSANGSNGGVPATVLHNDDDKERLTTSSLSRAWTLNGRLEFAETNPDLRPAVAGVMMRHGARRSGTSVAKRLRLNRRCSINGHFYRAETATDFTPTFGMPTRVRVTSRSSPSDVVAMLLTKFKIENPASDFGLYIVKDNGDLRALQADEPPLLMGTVLRDSPDVRLFLMDARATAAPVPPGDDVPSDKSVLPLDEAPATSFDATVVNVPLSEKLSLPSTAAHSESCRSPALDDIREPINGASHSHNWHATNEFESLPEPMLKAFLAKFVKDENEDIVRIQQRYAYRRKRLEALLRDVAIRSDSGLLETYL